MPLGGDHDTITVTGEFMTATWGSMVVTLATSFAASMAVNTMVTRTKIHLGEWEVLSSSGMMPPQERTRSEVTVA